MSTKYKQGGFYKLLPYLSIALIICIFGIYFGNIVFGTNSLSVLMDLRLKEQKMKDEVKHLTEQNANLQKEFFELKGLEPK